LYDIENILEHNAEDELGFNGNHMVINNILNISEENLDENSICYSEEQLNRLGIDYEFFIKIPDEIKQEVIESAFIIR